IRKQAVEQAAFLFVQISVCLFAEHCQHVEPIFPCIEIEGPFACRRMRHRAECGGSVGCQRRKKIYKARRVLGAGNFFVLFGKVRHRFRRLRRRLTLRAVYLRTRFLGLRLECNAFLQTPVRVELTPVSDLKGDLFVIVFLAYHYCYKCKIWLMSRSMDELIAVMERLRAPGGCPWDREQTYASLAQYLLEETYETFDAIQEADQTGDTANLREELGDLLLQVVFHSTIGAERGDFTIDEVARGVTKKLTLRHPHVFGDTKLARAQDVLDNWDTLKANERAASGKTEKKKESILDDVPVHFPALLEALKVTTKAGKAGFDWEDLDQVFTKLDEEVA